ncbi:Condensin complex subunit 2 [Vitis vinifera]|uniref:Condensin complex subunit 2 n=1 Tax=Vitis vinifera TaxID=29760 RepID=A0A438D3D8_VITVI|nr:Condensin complex subunit 2 [Vitis vinifera]
MEALLLSKETIQCLEAHLLETYKILGGINSASLVNEQGGGDNNNRDDEGHSKKEPDRKISPLSTLVSSFEALNVKRFDVAFTVDPLYHQTSAQFDGVKGLLLNNLAVYGGCRVLFDSLEVPGKCILCSSENNSSDMVAISFAKEYIEQMVMNMLEKNEISPTLRDIMCLFNEENQQPSHTFNEAVTDDGFTFGDPTIHSHYEGNDSYTSYEPDVDDRLENVATFLFQGLGFTSKKNVWAGSEDVPTEKAPDVFVPLKNPKLLLLPASREPCRNTLPEDCHYQPEDLVKLFLLPKVMPDVMGLEFQRSGTTYAATPWARIKGAQPACHAFQCHYTDWFRSAMDSSGEQLQLPTSLCRRWPSSSSSSSPQLVTSSLDFNLPRSA